MERPAGAGGMPQFDTSYGVQVEFEKAQWAQVLRDISLKSQNKVSSSGNVRVVTAHVLGCGRLICSYHLGRRTLLVEDIVEANANRDGVTHVCDEIWTFNTK